MEKQINKLKNKKVLSNIRKRKRLVNENTVFTAFKIIASINIIYFFYISRSYRLHKDHFKRPNLYKILNHDRKLLETIPFLQKFPISRKQHFPFQLH